MTAKNISWPLGSTPNKSLVRQLPITVGLVTSLLFRFTARVTCLRHPCRRTAYADRRHSLPVSLHLVRSACNAIVKSNILLNPTPPTEASIDRIQIDPDRSQTLHYQSQFSPDRFLKSLRIHAPLALHPCNTNHQHPIPIEADRSDRFFKSSQYSQSGPNIPDLSAPIIQNPESRIQYPALTPNH